MLKTFLLPARSPFKAAIVITEAFFIELFKHTDIDWESTQRHRKLTERPVNMKESVFADNVTFMAGLKLEFSANT